MALALGLLMSNTLQLEFCHIALFLLWFSIICLHIIFSSLNTASYVGEVQILSQ